MGNSGREPYGDRLAAEVEIINHEKGRPLRNHWLKGSLCAGDVHLADTEVEAPELPEPMHKAVSK
jgi:hypothetical protein